MSNAGVSIMLSLMFAVIPTLSQAVVWTDGEHPVHLAQLQVVQAAPALSHVKRAELVLTQRDGADTPTGFVLVLNGENMKFDVSRVMEQPCGDLLYIGMNEDIRDNHLYRLNVLDHSKNKCTAQPGGLHDLPFQYPIEVTLEDEGHALLQMEGKLESAITPM